MIPKSYKVKEININTPLHVVECGVAFDTLCICVEICTVSQNVQIEYNLGTSCAT